MPLICPACGNAIDPDGPAVAQSRSAGHGSDWLPAYWVPFVFDLRTNPLRLVHAECYAEAEGVKALVGLVHEREKLYHRELARRSDTKQLPLDGVDQARSLHRMLMERKFDGPFDEFFGSPHIAAIQHRLADLLAAAEPGKNWQQWRRADQHPQRVDLVRRHLQESTAWPNMDADTRRQYVQDVLAPLIPSPELLHELVNLQGRT